MARSNYADTPIEEELHGSLPVHRDRLSSDPRAYTPSDGEDDGGYYNKLVEAAGAGDWSWQPQRYQRDSGYTYSRGEIEALNEGWVLTESDERRAELEAQMPTYQPPRHPRACPSCHLTACLGPDYHELADTQGFQQRARAAHRQAGDYNRHTHDYSIL